MSDKQNDLRKKCNALLLPHDGAIDIKICIGRLYRVSGPDCALPISAMALPLHQVHGTTASSAWYLAWLFFKLIVGQPALELKK